MTLNTCITKLGLKDSIPGDSEGPSTYLDINLPCLRVLSISPGVGALTAVLHHITNPHSAILNLTCNEKKSTEINFSNFLSVLSTKFLSSLVHQRHTLRGSEKFDNTVSYPTFGQLQPLRTTFHFLSLRYD